MATFSSAAAICGVTIVSPRLMPLLRRKKFFCCAETPADQAASASTPDKPPLPQPPSSPHSISSSAVSAGLAAVGFVETGYLSFIKLTGTEALCLASAAACGDVLNSDYSVVFGIPLPLVGMIAYGSVALLSLQVSGKPFIPLSEADVRLALLGTTTSMAAASSYFLYILGTKFDGVSCAYCLFSAALSFTLFFLSVKNFGFEKIQKIAGIQLAIVGVVVLTLMSSYSAASPQLTGSDDFTLEYYETPVVKESSSFALSLAKHLKSIGAKIYGAFWCSHCHEQKEIFGSEAARILDYVECFPTGAGKGKVMNPECAAVGIQGFPTWIVKGKVLSGDQELSALADASGFDYEWVDPS